MIERAYLKRAIEDWMGWYLKTASQLVHREQEHALPKKNALALLGVRRCGKSYSAVDISRAIRDRTFYFNFEDPLFLEDNTVQNLDELISVFIENFGQTPQLLIFDEIQNIVGWERWIRKAVDLGKYQIILTGSSAKLLSSEISTSIAGRCLEENLWPLSYSEYLTFSHLEPKSGDEHLRYFLSYMQWGSFPEVVLLSTQEEKKKLLRQYLNDIVLKDIINRHQIRVKRGLDQIVLHYLTNLSSLHSYNSIKKAYTLNLETVQEYTQYLNEAFLFFEVPRFHPNLKVQARDPKKVYCIDTGLRNVNSFSLHDDYGKLAENSVYIHLRRLGQSVTYFKGHGEVDFLVMNFGKPIQAIQVCYSNLENPETLHRELTSLIECLKATGLKEGLILTLNREEQIVEQGVKIIFMPLYKWLLDSSLFRV